MRKPQVTHCPQSAEDILGWACSDVSGLILAFSSASRVPDRTAVATAWRLKQVVCICGLNSHDATMVHAHADIYIYSPFTMECTELDESH